MIRRPPRSTLFPYTRSSDLGDLDGDGVSNLDEYNAGTDFTDAQDVPVQEAKLVSGMVGQYLDRKSTRLNSSHVRISYAVFCLKKNSTPKLEHYLMSPPDNAE